ARSDLVEAGEGVGVAINVEYLGARCETIGSEGPEVEDWPLEGATAGAVGAEERDGHEERVGPQGEDIVEALGEVDEPEPGAPVLHRRFCSARGPGPQDAMVEDLHGRWEGAGPAIELDREAHDRRDQPRGRRGAGAGGAVGEQLDVALVQPRDGVAQAVGGEGLDPPESSVPVD